ncbi:MAG: ABC-F family ATP-binding cassette domain-containing protein [Luteococcus japonicus]|uniref:ABC-F family ATP-binding cassette domain-containing protein n=1 Tax=Luteococcus sp. TaxID=1969402 RepID=UPI0026495F1F|nr:ABC-F family ATP-binding cassette domain-containing protein [Luteococcus sp.]MDN5563258.1 ABC-F family ATP-binding cassette domain-containing protein [Luteococcus sp.]
MAATNILNAERVTKTYGTRTILDEVSLGLGKGDVIGVVGRNGDGKSTLLKVLTGAIEPDDGRVTRTGSVSIGVLTQAEQVCEGQTVRDLIVDGEPDHVWARDAYRRAVVEHLLADIDLDAELSRLSGGERRRAGLVSLMLGHHDLLVLDEPTNHLDVEAVAWLADHLNALQQRNIAMLVVSHDRWFLDAICNRVWEVHDGVVDPYDGGYAAYVLARAERSRQAAANEARRQNLVRKELAWLRRGAPARTSKPKFRIEAANTLIEDVPPPRDRLALEQFSVSRLGKDVFDLEKVTLRFGERTLLNQLTWSIGPGDRIGLLGVNGAGKTTLLNLLAHELSPTSGRVKQGKTLRLGHLSQHIGELDERETVLESVNRLKQETKLATGKDASASNLLQEFGFTGEKLVTRIGELSGGERRRLSFLMILMDEPNVLLLDEPTNDLDIDTLTVIEDYLDTWPGTMIIVSHDRYFLERVTDYTYALMGDGRCVLLPGGVDEYLEHRRKRPSPGSGNVGATGSADADAPATSETGAQPKASQAEVRQARKDMSRIDGQLTKLRARMEKIHARMAEAASDYAKLAELQAELQGASDEADELELAWLEAAEIAEG